MTMALVPDLTDYIGLLSTVSCPRGVFCERCGQLDSRRRQNVVLPIICGNPAGVFCLTLCVPCSMLPALLATPARPAISPRVLPKLIAQHSAHLDLAVSLNTDLTRKELHL